MGYIRDQLGEIVEQPLNQQTKGEADFLIRQIDYFNERLFALHGIVLKRN